MKRFCLIVLAVFLTTFTAFSQGFDYENKTNVGHGLYKVKSGDFYGIVDKNDNVVVSIEFQDILFVGDKALLTKDNILYGIVNTHGVVKSFEPIYKVHPIYNFVNDGFIIVGYKNRWGFISETGVPLRIKSGIIGGVATYGRGKPSMFDNVFPFVNGKAAVYTKKGGWKHIDKQGEEHFICGDQSTIASFRSSIHNGECIIVTNDGIKLYQEKGAQAVVKRTLSPTSTFVRDIRNADGLRLIYKEGTLTLDPLMRAYKFESANDSIILMREPEQEASTSLLKGDEVVVKNESSGLDVKLVYKNIKVNENAQAYTEVKLINTSKYSADNITVVLECGARREWNGKIAGNSEKKIPFTILARFSSPTLKKTIKVRVFQDGDCIIEKDLQVVIHAYVPVK